MVFSAIEDPVVIKKILKHLSLWETHNHDPLPVLADRCAMNFAGLGNLTGEPAKKSHDIVFLEQLLDLIATNQKYFDMKLNSSIYPRKWPVSAGAWTLRSI